MSPGQVRQAQVQRALQVQQAMQQAQKAVLPPPAQAAQGLFAGIASSISNVLSKPLFNRELPTTVEWYDGGIRAIKAALCGEELDDDDTELLWDINARIKKLVYRDKELCSPAGAFIFENGSPGADLDTKKLRRAVLNLGRGAELNFYDRKLLEELCGVLARVRASKTRYQVMDVSCEGDRIHATVNVQPPVPVETVELSFVVEPSKTWMESDTELERAITQKATHEIRQKLETALMAGVPKPGEWTPMGQGVNVAQTQKDMAAKEKFLGGLGFGSGQQLGLASGQLDGITGTANNGAEGS